MTKKDYKKLAAMRRPTTGEGPNAEAVWDDLVEETARIFRADNPHFDLHRFLKACRGD